MKKTYDEMLRGTKGFPRIEENEGKRIILPSPLEYDEAMRLAGPGQLITYEEINIFLARKHGADETAGMSTGIFANLVAHASAERKERGSDDITPYWRTLKKKGELNERFPGGIAEHKRLLEQEGHKVIQKGKKWVVADYEKSVRKV